MKFRVKAKEVVVLLIVIAMSVAANLPEDYAVINFFNRKFLLGTLGVVAIIAMFRYLQMMLLVIITILGIGAKLPAELASDLGVEQTPLIVVMAVMILIVLANRFRQFVPVYEEPPADTNERTIARLDEDDARHLLLDAIAHGKTSIVLDLLARKTEINFTMNGTTPLHLATEKGYPNIVQMLINNGADLLARDEKDRTPLDLALEVKKYQRTTDILYKATIPLLQAGQGETPPPAA